MENQEIYLKNGTTQKNNTIIFTGSCEEGSLAQEIIDHPEEVQLSEEEAPPIKINMSVDVVSFSAHWDYKQNFHFIKSVKPTNIILVHGDQTAMEKLKSQLDLTLQERINVLAPYNCEELKFDFEIYKSANLVGKLKDETPKILQNTKFSNLDDDYLLKWAQNLESKELISLAKVIDFDDQSSGFEDSK